MTSSFWNFLSFFSVLVVMMSFQNCSQNGFKTNDPLSSTAEVTSLATEIDFSAIKSDPVDAAFFDLETATTDTAFLQTQIARLEKDGQAYISWIAAVGLYSTGAINPATHITEYELSIYDQSNNVMCTSKSGNFTGIASTLRGTCVTLNINRKAKFDFKYRTQSATWKTLTWLEP